MRGEHQSLQRTTNSRPGSSPHARGALNNSQFDIVSFGIIPACAGSTVLLKGERERG